MTRSCLSAAGVALAGLCLAAPGWANTPPGPPLARAGAHLGGKRWPGRGIARITYYNRSESKWPVAAAVRAWNTSGAGVRFVAAPRGRARVVISDSPGARSDGFVSGFATLGYTPPGVRAYAYDRNGNLHVTRSSNYVKLSHLAHPQRPHYRMAGVVAHELGHVLGLNHEDRWCATMNSVLWSHCSSRRPCRLLERDDIEGAVRRYGGRVLMRTPDFCPKGPRRLRLTSTPRDYSVALQWRNPRGLFFKRMSVSRARGKCPDRPSAGASVPVVRNRPGAMARAIDTGLATGSRLRTGRYCYAFWGTNGFEVLGRRKTFWVDFKPQRPSAPSGVSITRSGPGEVRVSWTFADHPEIHGFELAARRDQCPTEPGSEAVRVDKVSSATISLSGPGRWCIGVWTVDTVGGRAGPATAFFDYAGEPPQASFYANADGRSVCFFDDSFDPDNAIVAWSWDFGDGTGSTERNPGRTYAVAGDYTVRLTVTDEAGLTGTTTQTISVVDSGFEQDPPVCN